MDHAQLVHAQWLFAATHGLEIFIKRVATEDNIADLPSREVGSSPFLMDPLTHVMFLLSQECDMLLRMGADEWPPKLSAFYNKPRCWRVLPYRWQRQAASAADEA